MHYRERSNFPDSIYILCTVFAIHVRKKLLNKNRMNLCGIIRMYLCGMLSSSSSSEAGMPWYDNIDKRLVLFCLFWFHYHR